MFKKLYISWRDADVRFHISSILVSLSALLCVLRYALSVRRLVSACVDFGLSVAYWFVFLTEGIWEGLLGYVPMIPNHRRELPNIDLSSVLSFSLEELLYKLSVLIPSLFNLENFGDYNLWLINFLYWVCFYGSMLIPAFIGAWLLFRDGLVKDLGNPHGMQTKTVGALLCVWKSVFRPCVRGFRSMVLYIYDRPLAWGALLFIWLVNLNVITVLLEVLGFYFYFVSSFDLFSFFVQLLKLLIDALIMLDGLPLLLWLPMFAVIYWAYASAKGLDTLRHFDAMNCGFLKSISYITLIVGNPGVGKTTLLTSFSLYFVNIFKRDSFDTLYDIEMTFPTFPFAAFRKELSERIDSGLIRNIPMAREYVSHIEESYAATPSPALLFGYDTELFAMEKNIGTKITTLFSAMSEYASAFFIYKNENPNFANYPIRFDGSFDNSPYLPRWNGDFYSKDIRRRKEESRYSHILDQDMLRMGKHVDEENPNIGAFGFGIYSNTEWGKGRGNQLTTVDEDKASEIANRKNDLYSYSLKMSRHANSTVANKVYFRFLGDEQRPESLAADQRELCDVIYIKEKSEIKLALPHFAWLDKLYDKLYLPFKDFWEEYSNSRGDTCLTMFLLKIIVGGFSNVYKRIYNKYGYYTLMLGMRNGRDFSSNGSSDASDERIIEYNMPVMQVYSERYETDCFSGFFTKAQLDCAVGINDIECFTGLTQTTSQMVSQHDFFLNELMGIMEKDTGVSAKRAPKSTANKQSSQVPDMVFRTFGNKV